MNLAELLLLGDPWLNCTQTLTGQPTAIRQPEQLTVKDAVVSTAAPARTSTDP